MKNQQQLPKDGRASQSVYAASFNSLSQALRGPLQAPDWGQQQQRKMFA